MTCAKWVTSEKNASADWSFPKPSSALIESLGAVPKPLCRHPSPTPTQRVTLQPAHRNKRHAWIDLAIPAPVDDPRLLTVRGQLVCCRSGQQDWLPNLNYGYPLVRGTEQIGQYGICIHKGLPFAQIVACEMGLGLRELGRCDFHHTQCPPESKSDSEFPRVTSPPSKGPSRRRRKRRAPSASCRWSH